MKNRFFLLLIFFIVIVIFIYQTFIIQSQKQKNSLLYQEFIILKGDKEILESSIKLSWHIEGKNIIGNIYNEKRKVVTMNDICKDDICLIFRMSKLNCTECINEYINILDEAEGKGLKYYIIADYDNERNLALFKRVNNIKMDVYSSDYLYEDEIKEPYFFIYQNDIMSKVMFPNDNFEELTKYYLDFLCKENGQ